MVQKAYTDLNIAAFDPVSISGMQTRATDILHGTFRTELRLEGYNGGSCASFFWYHDDTQELDIEVVTPGTSIVNDTINYTTQPSVNADWSRIPNATFSMPLEKTMSDFKTHRFDCDPKKGVSYYLDDKLLHTDTHNVPKAGGSLQLKLWADGNKYWSGLPSKTDVSMHVKSIIAYFNTTSSLNNDKWDRRCAREKVQCKAVLSTHPKAPTSVSTLCTDKYCQDHTLPSATISSGFTIVPLEPTLTTSRDLCGGHFLGATACSPKQSTYMVTPIVTLGPVNSANRVSATNHLDGEGLGHLKRNACFMLAGIMLLFVVVV